jgi:glutathione peroxidase
MTQPIESIPVKTIDGTEATLGDWSGKVRLVVNVASKCGLTPQYEALEQLYETYSGKGLEVLGFPANNFREQEPGTNDEISEFCSTTYGVKFPLFSKISVKGADQHPLYAALEAARPAKTFKDDSFKERLAGFGIKPDSETEVLWNFEKFLIGRDGAVIGRFAPDISPQDPIIVEAVEAAL